MEVETRSEFECRCGCGERMTDADLTRGDHKPGHTPTRHTIPVPGRFWALMRVMSQTIRRGTELRKVEVEVRMHTPRPGMKRMVRLDTGDVVRDEQMSEDERQAGLFEEDRQLHGMFNSRADGKSAGAGQ